MKEQPSNPCEKVSFILTYDQLEAAYNIYREQPFLRTHHSL